VKKIAVILLVVALSLIVAGPAYAHGATPADNPPKGGRHGTLGVILVTSTGLYYDTFVPVQELPWNGNDESFQPLYPQGPGEPSETPYGPGDPGFKGGRWWVDSNPNGYQDADDTFVLCPLFGPGRTSP